MFLLTQLHGIGERTTKLVQFKINSPAAAVTAMLFLALVQSSQQWQSPTKLMLPFIQFSKSLPALKHTETMDA